MALPRMKPEILAALELQGRILHDISRTCGKIAHALKPDFYPNEGADTLQKRQGEIPWDSRQSNQKSLDHPNQSS